MAPRANPSSTAYSGAVIGDHCGRNMVATAAINPPNTPTAIAGPMISGFEGTAYQTQLAENVASKMRAIDLVTVPWIDIRSPVQAAVIDRRAELFNAGFERSMC